MLTIDRLYFIYQTILNIIKKKKRDDQFNFLEIGVYKGGTSSLVYQMLKDFSNIKNENIRIIAVDTFDGHQLEDLGDHDEYHHSRGFKNTSYEYVKNKLKNFPGCEVYKSRIQDVTSKLPPKFDFIHLDTDLYDPTMFTLEEYGHKLDNNSIILVDDYDFKTCPGVFKAVNEFVDRNTIFTKFSLMTGQCLLIKN